MKTVFFFVYSACTSLGKPRPICRALHAARGRYMWQGNALPIHVGEGTLEGSSVSNTGSLLRTCGWSQTTETSTHVIETYPSVDVVPRLWSGLMAVSRDSLHQPYGSRESASSD